MKKLLMVSIIALSVGSLIQADGYGKPKKETSADKRKHKRDIAAANAQSAAAMNQANAANAAAAAAAGHAAAIDDRLNRAGIAP